MHAPATEHGREFGDTIKALRLARGWTLRGFAKAIETSPSYLLYIETAHVPPPSDRIICRMAELLEVSPIELLTKAGRLSPEIWSAFWQHPAIPPILSTIPGKSLQEAQTFVRQVVTSLPQSTSAYSDATKESGGSVPHNRRT